MKLKNSLRNSLFILPLFLMSWGVANVEARTDGEYLHKVKREFVTPHLDWATNLEGGPVRALFLTPRKFGAREVAELAQRLGLDYEAFVSNNFVALAVDSIYEAGVQGTSAFEKAGELLEKVRKPYDVIVLANLRFQALPAEAQYHILKQVSEGAGLVITYPADFPFPKVFDKPVDAWEKILGMVDLKALPGSAASRKPADLLKTYQFGKGRVAVLNYGAQYANLGLTAHEDYSLTGWKARYENNLALVGRVIQWAAGRDISPTIHPTIEGDTVRLAVSGAPEGGLQARIRDIENQVVLEKKISLPKEAGQEIALDGLPAGTYFLDLRWGADSKVSGFGVFKIERPFAGGKIELKSDKLSYEAGEKVTVTVSLEKPLEQDAEILVKLRDLPEKNLWKKQVVKLPKGAQTATATFSDTHIPTIAGWIEAEVNSGGRLLARNSTVAYFPRRDIELFPTILWESIPPDLSEMYAQQLDQSVPDAAALSHPGANGERGLRAALFNQRFIPYMTRIGLKAGEKGETLSDHWLGLTKEEAGTLTGGDGSIFNPAVRDAWKKSIEKRIVGLPEIGPLVYTLGDENHFSYEAGFSPSDTAAFHDFLKTRYTTIEALNKEWGTSYKNFEEITRSTPDEMLKKGEFSLLYAHRRFMETQYAETHNFLARAIKAIDPRALVGAEGSVPGDIELTTKELDFWGPYGNTIDDEVLRAVAPDKLRTIWWGYGGEYLAYPLWGPLLKGTVNGNAWYTSDIEAPSGLMSVDFSLAEYYKNERKPFVDALNHGVGPALITTPLKKHGIAILWSHASYSASFMDEKFPNPRDSAGVLLSFLYRIGLNFDFVTSSMVEKGVLKNYKTLWLPGATALSEKESEAILEFANSGGVVVADIKPGVLNASLGKRDNSPLAPLFGLETLKGASPLRMKAVEVDADLRGKRISFKAAKSHQASGVPVFSAKEYGKGLGILLNFNLSSAANTAEGGLDAFLASLFQLAGIAPEVTIEGLTSDQLVVRLRESADGQILGVLAGREDIGKTAKITLPASRWIYEVDKGFLSEGKTLEVKFDVPLKVFSLFDRKQEPPVFEISSPSAAVGGALDLRLNQLSSSGIFRLEVTPPDGRRLRRLTRIFAGSKAESQPPLRFALSDAPGKYEIVLTDIRTGLSTTHAVEITGERDSQ